MRRPSTTARRLVAALAVPAVLIASGCGGEEETPRPALSDTEHNAADVAFATEMIPHHAQALAMVDLTRGRELTAETATLVESIRDAQAPEIETMVDWLTEWGEDVPATMRDHVNAGHGGDEEGDEHGDDEHGGHGSSAGASDSMEHTEHDMPGMMSPEEMDELAAADDTEFEDLWLEMMVEHHEGAVEMAQTQRDEGRFRPAVDLAAAIVESQNAEIEKMEALLAE